MSRITATDLSATDQCVLCGMCSAVCPTYQLNGVEMESPRGRISIIQHYADLSSTPSKHALDHIGHCTGCNQCQSICPSLVPFEKLIDQFKYQHADQNSFFMRFFLKLATKPRGFNRFKSIAKLYKNSTLPRLIRYPAVLRHAHQLLNHIHDVKQTQTERLTTEKHKASVGLFIGCTEQLLDQQTLNDTLQVLAYFDVQVIAPEEQFCCGALHQHNGHPDTANHLSQKNEKLFSQHKIKQVLFCASGCGRQLKQSKTDIEFIDVLTFISPYLASHPASFKPLDKEIYIHDSCSSHSLKTNHITTQLLKKIPSIQLKNISSNSCCGAGGSNHLFYPELAKELIADKIQQIKQTPPKFLVSDNIGCSLHFKKQLAASGIDVEVIHPISLIARQLK